MGSLNVIDANVASMETVILAPRMKYFIPAVTDHIPTMHVTGDDGRLARPSHIFAGPRASVSNSRLTNK